MSVNGHFATMGEKATQEQYEHGIQVINENQEFKYVLATQSQSLQTLMSCAVIVLIFLNTSRSRKSPRPASITT